MHIYFINIFLAYSVAIATKCKTTQTDMYYTLNARVSVAINKYQKEKLVSKISKVLK